MATFDIEQLRTFMAVAEAGSLTAAAPRVFLSQSSVSEQVRKLEERAGRSLFTRSKAGVAMTEAGARLLVHARAILALSETAYREMRDEQLQGTLRLAITDYFRPAELAGLLARLGERYPQVRLHVSVMKSGEVEAGYACGEVDVGVAMRIVQTGAGTVSRGAVLRREALVWMGARGLSWQKGSPLRLLVLPDTCALHQFTVKLLRQRRVPHEVAHVASGVAGLQSALAAGLGVACLNESALCDGVVPLRQAGLPALPRVAFHVLPTRQGESDFVARARELLVAQFA
ncbi:LysR family transcriptional regulator [Variovorax sp. LT1P1]|uniref:LysR family transcriptional regulator n=1 Tax=Variovorax sp. LT1P1 TaxID=3443730 RepID=UPI003F481C1E